MPDIPRRTRPTIFATFLFTFALFSPACVQSDHAETRTASIQNTSTVAAPSPALQTNDAQTITVKAVGDIMLGSTFPEGVPLPPEDGALMLKDVAPILVDADLTFGNLEGPMTEGGVSTKCGDRPNCCLF